MNALFARGSGKTIRLGLPILLAAGTLFGQAVRNNEGFRSQSVPRNDDGSSALVPLGFSVNFFGKTRTHAYVNNNGNITFDSALATFTPFGLVRTRREIIAAFFSDVDTRPTGSALVTFGRDSIGGRNAFGVNFVNVGYYNQHTDKLNSLQLILIERSDTGEGNFDIEFNYDRIHWETGDASEGVNGFGGVSAAVGWSNGSGEADTFFELEGSLIPGSFLDGGVHSLIRNRLNSRQRGRYVFRARDGSIQPALTILTGCPLPPATLNIPYVQQFNAIGGTNYRWTMVADPGASLPGGMTLSATGQFSGTPSSPDATDFTVRMTATTEDGEQTLSRRCSLTVNPPTVTITSACPLPQATVGQTYSRALLVTGGRAPYTWSLGDDTQLPPGLSLSSGGLLSGVPTAPGTANFVLRAESNAADAAQPANKFCSLTVNAAVLDLTSSCALPGGTTGVPFSRTLSVNGGTPPYSWSAATPLPQGLGLLANGTITGTPLGAGSYSFNVQVTDSRGRSTTQSCSLNVQNPQLTISTACPLPAGTTGESYGQRLEVSGGTPPFSWSIVGALPSGLSVTGEGVLAGTPETGGGSSFRLLVTDSEGRAAAKPCAMLVERASFGLQNCPLPNATTGVAYSQLLRPRGAAEPFLMTAANLPAGLTLSSSGRLTGTPVKPGTVTVSVQIIDAVGRSTTAPCRVTVNPSPVQIAGECPAPAGRVGVPFQSIFTASGGEPPYRFSVLGELPPGLTMSSAGALAGTATSAADANFVIEVRDAQNRLASRACSLSVALPPVPRLQLRSTAGSLNPASLGPTVTIELSEPYPLAIQGQFVLTFAPETGTGDAQINRGDPRVRFSNGQRIASFTIPPGSREASATVASTGTVAGAVQVGISSLRAGGRNLTLSPPPRVFRLARSAPVLTDACFVQRDNTFEAVLTGYTTTRELTGAEFHLTPVTGSERELSVSLVESSAEYFSGDESVRNGGAFTLSVPVAIEGGPVKSASVTVSNAVGETASRPLSACR